MRRNDSPDKSPHVERDYLRPDEANAVIDAAGRCRVPCHRHRRQTDADLPGLIATAGALEPGAYLERADLSGTVGLLAAAPRRPWRRRDKTSRRAGPSGALASSVPQSPH